MASNYVSGGSNIDVEELQRFRFAIQDRVVELDEQLQRTNNAIETVAETWKDRKFEEFRKGFSEDVEQIRKLSEILTDYESNVLHNFQVRLEDYLNS